jgi:tetratricopeptide (TPR) repeat protein
MVSVFLSHSSIDKPFVRELADFLEEGGEIKTWLDEREIDYGENIVARIGEGLDSDAVLLILSPDSVESNWVKEEWTDAHWEQTNNQQTKLAGVLYRDCKIPRLLGNKKYFDLRKNHPDGFRQIKSWLLGLRPYAQPVVHLPPRPPLFVGREPELKELRRRLREPGSIVYVPGLPGRGKTTLALQFAHLYQHDFEAVHWLPCQSHDLPYLVGELARQMGMKLEGDPETSLRDLVDAFARKRTLLLLDNVEDEAPGRLIPGGQSSVLITTRRLNLRFLNFHKPLDLPLFTEQQCLELFRDVLGEKEVSKEESAAKTLFKKLGHLPFAVAIAAGLVKHDVHHTIASLAANPPDDALSLLKTAIATLPQAAQALLSAVSACAAEGFRLPLASEIASLDDSLSLNALQELTSRSLLEELDRTTRRYRAHALVRQAAARPELLRRRHAESVKKQFQSWETDWRQCEEDLADLQHALTWALKQSETSVQWAWPIADWLAFYGYALTRRLGRLPEAHEICDRLVHEATAQDRRQSLQRWLGNQAVILQAWGRLEEAMALLKKQEAICLELNDRTSLQRSYGNQAVILQAWGRLEEAMALHKKKEAICLELNERASLQISYGNQALILKAWGRLEEAMALHKKEEAICLELNDRAGLQISYGNQALILQDWGRLEESMALLQKQETICLELNDRASLQASYGNQALILQAWGRLEEAMALHKKKEAICLELNDRAALGASYGNQALILKAWGRLEEAMALHKKEETICLELNDRASLQASYGNQALMLQDWGRLEEAMALLQKKESICLELNLRSSLGHCRWAIAGLLIEQGDIPAARRSATEALSIFTALNMPRETEAVKDLLKSLG